MRGVAAQSQALEVAAHNLANVNTTGFSPTIGIIGAVLGLIQVMQHLDKIDEVGRGIVVAFVATIYGVGAANLFFLPVAGKLKIRIREEQIIREMTLEGVISILEGMNRRVDIVILGRDIETSPPARGVDPSQSPTATAPPIETVMKKPSPVVGKVPASPPARPPRVSGRLVIMRNS